MQTVCRLCLQPEQRDITPLFCNNVNVNDDECQKLRLQITDLCSIVILQDDDLPKVICWKCKVRLQDAYEFINLCKNSNNKLHECNEKNKHCQILEVISLKEKKQKSKGTEQKFTDRSSRRKSLRAHSKIVTSSETYNTASSQNILDVETAKSESDDRSDNFKIQETSLNERVTPDANARCDELSGDSEKREVISLKEKGQKPKGKEHKLIDRSRSRRKSLRARSEIVTSSETYNTASSQNILDVETAKSESDDRSDLDFKIQETSLNERVTPDTNARSDELSGDSEKQYLCHVCSKTFASMSGLQLHLKSHYGIKPYACQYCGKSFAIPSYKKRHEKIHTGDKRFICQFCSTAFASSNGLKYHLKTHTGEANYRCDTCGKSFVRYKYLKDHIFTHTGEKPYVCKLCGSAYGNSGSLFVHEKKCKSRHDSQRDVSKTVVVQ